MFNSKFYKFICFFSVFILIFAFLFLPVSATSEIPDYPTSAELPPISLAPDQKAFLFYRYELGLWGYILCNISGNVNTSILHDYPSSELTGYLNVTAIRTYVLDGQSWVTYSAVPGQVNFYPYSYNENCRIIVSVSQGSHDNINFTVDSSNWNSYFSGDSNSWYDNIFSGLSSLWQSVKNLGTDIGNWFNGLGDRISGFFTDLYNNIIEGLKSLFIPTISIFPLIKEKFNGKFPIIDQASGLFDGLLNPGTAEPNFVINFKGHTLKIIDFSMFVAYMPMIRTLTAVFIWLSFLTKEVKKLPALLRGQDTSKE